MGSDFFVPVRAFTVADIARLTGAELLTPDLSGLPVTGLGSLDDARPGQLAFVDGKRNAAKVATLKASAVICPPDVVTDAPAGLAVLAHRNPQRAFAQAGREMFPEAAVPVGATGVPGISPGAHVHPDATLEDGVTVEAGAVVGADVSIGAGTVVAANAVLGPHCRVGRDCYIGSNVTIRYAMLGDRVVVHAGAVIGHDGYGFTGGTKGPERIPQVGRVVIQDDVEVGCNSSIDRGALSDTVIGEGTKIDNLVQIGHNTRVGRCCLIAGHCGIAGSVVIGDLVRIGGGVGIGDHVTIGDGAQIIGRSGIMDHIPAGTVWGGYPAVPRREFFRQVSFLREVGKKAKGGGDD